MLANLLPHSEIPRLAGLVTPKMFAVLRRIQKADFIANGAGVDAETAEVLQQLSDLGLVDAGYDPEKRGQPLMWVANGNGSRVFAFKVGIRGGPHYEITSTDLADWLEEQGRERWWNVDGDPLLTGRLSFPLPAEPLAAQLRKIGRPLLVQAKKEDAEARGQMIGKDRFDAVVDRFGNNVQTNRGGELPPWSADRLLYLCWKGAIDEWLLVEDSETTALMSAEAVVGQVAARATSR